MASAELQIGKRAYQEAMRICESAAVANKMIGCNLCPDRKESVE